MTETDKRRWAIVVANEKGGVGKSTLALAITDKLAIAGYSPVVIQIDRQKRLSAALGQDVITISSDPKAARSDPCNELPRFSPLLQLLPFPPVPTMRRGKPCSLVRGSPLIS